MRKSNLGKVFLLFLVWEFITTSGTFAQEVWHNVLHETENAIDGRWWGNELRDSYARLPQRWMEAVRQPVQILAKNTAGLSVMFQTNSNEITVRYAVEGGLSMWHMPATGVAGVDMYAIDKNGTYRWCGAEYSFSKDTVTYCYKNVSAEMAPAKGYKFRLYLPLYASVKWMEIGVKQGATWQLYPASQEKPIVVYGTSIAQGACASRPGMAWSNILARESGHRVVNLGFSGNGRLEPELFAALAEIDAKLYIIDCMPNMEYRLDNIIPNTVSGVKKLRSVSNAPVLLVEHCGNTNELSSLQIKDLYTQTNIRLKKAYKQLQDEGIKGIFYLSHEDLALCMDAMVEGVHPTDLGMRQYADAYLRKVRAILK